MGAEEGISRENELNKVLKSYSAKFEASLGGPALAFAEVYKKTSENRQAYLVDVRSVAEREVSMVEGALSRDEFEALDLDDKSEVIVYCTIGYRSGKYACSLKRKGLKAYNAQGIVPFSHDPSCKLVKKLRGKGDEPTNKIHVYGPAWDLAGPGYETVTFSLWRQVTTFLFG